MSLIIPSRQLDRSPARWTVGDNSGATAGIIPEMGVGWGWGPRTVGKSLVLGVELGLAIANGTPWFGHPATKGKVVYCAGEGVYDLGIRIEARLAREERDRTLAIAKIAQESGDEAARQYAASLPPFTDDNLYIIPKTFVVPLISPSMTQTDSLRNVITEIQRLNTPGEDDIDPETGRVKDSFLWVQLVILDPAAKFAGRSQSNDNSANLIMSGLAELSAAVNSFVLVIAHPTEKGDKMLGAGALLNLADTDIEIRKDEVSAPGAPQTASIISHKSKYSALFPTIGYQVEPCEWDQPELGDDGQPDGKMVRVRSATVRMLEGQADSRPAQAGPAQEKTEPRKPLPEIRDVEKPSRRRTGIRPEQRDHHGLTVVPASTAPPGTRSLNTLIAEADTKRDAVHLVLAQQCPDCGRQGGVGCDARMEPAPLLLGRLPSGPLYAHESRVEAAMNTLPDAAQDAFLTTALPA